MFKKSISKIFGSIYEDMIDEEEYFREINNGNGENPNQMSRLNLSSPAIYSVELDSRPHTHVHSDNIDTVSIRSNHRNELIYTQHGQKCYRDFDTIDWMSENISSKISSFSTKAKLLDKWGFVNAWKFLFEMSSGWFIMLAIGFLGGILLPFMLVGAEWLTDLRQGYCSNGYFNSHYECCRLTEISYSYSRKCADWVTWAEAMGFENPAFKYTLNYLLYVLSSVVTASIAAMIVKLVAPYSCGTGITEIKTILSGFVIKGFLGIRTSFVKFVVSFLTIGSGLNVSHEGVLIHVCSSTANWLSRSIRKFNSNAAKLREVVGAGACAGFSVAFSAPISGLLFGLESMCYHFPSKTVWRTFSCVLFATFMFLQFKHMVDSDEALLPITSTGVWHFRELIPFSLLGILGGVFGALFKFLIKKFSFLRKNTILGNHPIAEVAFLAFATSMISFPISIYRSGNYGALRYIFSVCLPYDVNTICMDNHSLMEPTIQPLLPNSELKSLMWKLPLFGLLKLVLTAATTSAKIPTGFFLPIFIVGACFGRSIGVGMEFLHVKYAQSSFFQHMCYELNHRCISPEVYAVIGACAFLSGVTHLTITLTVLIVELTNKDDYIVPMMLCVTLSKLISEKLMIVSVFQCQSEINNYPYMDRIVEKTLDKSMKTSIVTLCLQRDETSYKNIIFYADGMNLSDIFHALEHEFYGYPLVDNNINMKLLGYVKRHELMDFMNELSINDQLNCDNTILNQQISFSSNNLSNECINFSAVIDYNIIQVDIKSSIDVLAEYFQLLGIRNVLVISHGIYGLYLLDCVCEHLGLLEKEFFGLRYIHPKEKQFTWLDPRKSIKYQLKEGPYSFYLAVKFFPPHPNTLADEQTRYHFIIYLRELILKKKLTCTPLLGQELSACVIQAEFGDYDLLTDKNNYLNGVFLYPGQDEDFIKGVIKLHKQLKGVSTIDCENRFLSIVTKIPNYGIESHEVTYKSSKLGELVKCLLGVYWGGLLEMYDNDTKNLCSWENLISASFLKKTLKLKIRVTAEDSDRNIYHKHRFVKYKCSTRTSTKRLYKSIVETHTFFRRHSAPAIPNGPTFHSKFRFIGKTFSQSRSSLYSSGSRMSDFGSVQSGLNDSVLTVDSDKGKATFYPNTNNWSGKRETMIRSIVPVPPEIVDVENYEDNPNVKKNYKTEIAIFNINPQTKANDGPNKTLKKSVGKSQIIRLIQAYNLKIADFDEKQNIYYC